MKKLVYILLVFTLVFSFAACGEALPEPDENTLVFQKKELQSMIDENEGNLEQGAIKEKLLLATEDDNYKKNSSVSPDEDFLVYVVFDEDKQKFKVYTTTKEAKGEVALTDYLDEVPQFEWSKNSDLIIRLGGNVDEEKK